MLDFTCHAAAGVAVLLAGLLVEGVGRWEAPAGARRRVVELLVASRVLLGRVLLVDGAHAAACAGDLRDRSSVSGESLKEEIKGKFDVASVGIGVALALALVHRCRIVVAALHWAAAHSAVGASDARIGVVGGLGQAGASAGTDAGGMMLIADGVSGLVLITKSAKVELLRLGQVDSGQVSR